MKCCCGVNSSEVCDQYQNDAFILEAENIGFAKVHRKRVDTYCLQHPNKHLISATSFAAHLMGLCIAMEYNNDPSLFKVIQKWEYGRGKVTKPKMLENFGDLTIEYILSSKSSKEYEDKVNEWAKSVWTAYAEYHELAKTWINLAKN